MKTTIISNDRMSGNITALRCTETGLHGLSMASTPARYRASGAARASSREEFVCMAALMASQRANTLDYAAVRPVT
jgi:hypothetical protein